MTQSPEDTAVALSEADAMEAIGLAIYKRRHSGDPLWPVGVNKDGYHQEPYVDSIPDWKWRGYEADARAAVAALSQPVPGGAPDGWRDITTAPKDGTFIIYLTKYCEIGYCQWQAGLTSDDYPCWWDIEHDDEACPRLWMPATALPDRLAALTTQVPSGEAK